MRKGGGSLNLGRPGLDDKGSPLVSRPGGPDRGLGSLPDGPQGGGPDDGPGGRLGERPDGPCGPRGALVLAAVEGYLRGRKAGRVPHCVPRVPRGGRKGDLHGDTGGCSSRRGTRQAGAGRTGRVALAVLVTLAVTMALVVVLLLAAAVADAAGVGDAASRAPCCDEEEQQCRCCYGVPTPPALRIVLPASRSRGR